MQSKEILTAPIADAITPSGVVDSPSACGALIFTDMKLIKLTQGFSAKVDDWNYNRLNQWKWFAQKSKNTYYAIRHDPLDHKKQISMHRFIMDTPANMQTDHRNHNGLDNQEHNIRNCTPHQNNCNRQSHGKSKFLGVSFWRGRIKGTITINRKAIHLGYFATEEDAARAYDRKARELFGEFAGQNFK